MKTSKQLSAQLAAFNASRPANRRLHVTWGRQAGLGTWFAHGEYGSELKTGLHFADVCDYVEEAISRQIEYDQAEQNKAGFDYGFVCDHDQDEQNDDGFVYGLVRDHDQAE